MGRRTVGKRVAIIGAGGIGFDVAELLTHGGRDGVDAFRDEWGIDGTYAAPGGLKPPHDAPPPRDVWLLQRKTTKVGADLAKTTGWIRRTLLKRRGVTMLAGVAYARIDDAGLHVTVDGTPRTLDADTIVVCAGQKARRELLEAVRATGVPVQLVGGADVAAELDAERAIAQGTRAALAL